MSKEQQAQQPSKKPPQRPSPVQETTPVAELTPAQTGLQNPDQLPGLPAHPTARPIRQATVLRMQQQQGNTTVQRLLTRTNRHNGHNHTTSTAETESDQSQEFLGAGAPTLTSAPPPDAPDNGPNGSHPAARPPAIQREENGGEDDTPTEAEKAAALAAAQEAEAQANQSATEAHQEVDKSQTAKETEKQASNTAQDKTNQAKEEAKAIATNGATAANGAAPPAPPKAPTAKQSPNGTSGDMVAPPTPTPGDKGPDYVAPKSPAEDPAFQGVGSRVKKVAAGEKDHAPATAKADEAAAAAAMPASETEARAQNNQAGKMESAETPPFDAAAFKARLMQRIQELAPKNAAEADNFKESNKLDGMKGEMNNQVAAEKETSKTPMAEAANAAPDTSAIPPKSVTPIPEAQPGDMPPPVGAEQAAPKQHGIGEVEQPLAESSHSLDDKMAEAEVTEDQLTNANEPEFTAALDSKEEAQTHAKEAPVEVRTTEQEHITNAEAEATAVAQEHTQAMHSDRTSLLGQVEGRQDVAKSEDEQTRQKIAADINRIYDDTKTKVDGILERLDGEVARVFSEGAEAAKKAFEDYVDAKMEAYKQKRYGGWFGWARWVKDKLAGMPSEVNVFYTEGRNLFLSEMDAVIDNVVAIIGRGMAEAKAEIANGRKQIQDYIAQLPEDLQSVGQEAAETIQGKFDSLEESVDNKQNELIDTLANKYQEHLQAVDARIEEMKAANAGLIDKALNAIVGVIKIILELKNLLLSVLSSAADAVMAIIKDPIGFIGSLISAIGQGLRNFVSNALTHLKTGFIEWLTSTLGGAGIQMPADIFSLEGVFDLVLQILGLTWESIRARAVRLLGEPVVNALETAFEIFKIIKDQGLAGLWHYIQDQISNLQEIVIEGIQEMLITEVIEAGIQWLIGILGGPAGAFIKAAKAIIDIVMWFVNNAQRIASLLQSIMQSVTAIASGNLSAAAQYVEESLARFIPTAIGFLASLLGIGDLAPKVRKIIDKVQEPINAAIDWVLEQARKVARRIGKALGLVSDDEAGEKPGDGKTGDGEVGETVAFNAGGEGHRLWYNVQGTAVTVMVASETTPLEAKIAQWETSLQNNADMMGEDANRARTLINTAKNMLGLTQSAGEEAAREKEEADKTPGDDRQEAEFETADNQAEEAEQNLADVLTQLFQLFGETPPELKGDAKAKLDQVIADNHIPLALRNQYRDAIFVQLMQAGADADQYGILKSVVAQGDYFAKGPSIPTNEIESKGGMTRTVPLRTIWADNLDPAYKAQFGTFEDWLQALAADITIFNPNAHLDPGSTVPGRYATAWWAPRSEQQGNTMAELIEELALNPTTYEGGCVRVTVSAQGSQTAGFRKPTALDGIFFTEFAPAPDNVWGVTAGGSLEAVAPRIALSDVTQKEFLPGNLPGSDDDRSPAQKQADLERAIAEVEQIMSAEGTTVEDVRAALPEIQERYRLKSLTLVEDSESSYHVEGEVNPHKNSENFGLFTRQQQKDIKSLAQRISTQIRQRGQQAEFLNDPEAYLLNPNRVTSGEVVEVAGFQDVLAYAENLTVLRNVHLRFLNNQGQTVGGAQAELDFLLLSETQAVEIISAKLNPAQFRPSVDRAALRHYRDLPLNSLQDLTKYLFANFGNMPRYNDVVDVQVNYNEGGSEESMTLASFRSSYLGKAIVDTINVKSLTPASENEDGLTGDIKTTATTSQLIRYLANEVRKLL